MQIPGYELLETLREGGSTTVLKAKSETLGTTVMLHVLHGEQTEEGRADLAATIERARLTAQLHHKGIVRITDVGTHDGMGYVVTEYVDGVTLGRKIALGISVKDADLTDLISQVAETLGHAWEEKGIYHGNLKPESIMYASDGGILVSNLGFARPGVIADPHTGESRKIIIGTPNYMSPEQVLGWTTLDCRSDIYSMGATLYHFATGKPPFADTLGQEAMARQLWDQVDSPGGTKRGISSGMITLLRNMMVKNPSQRYGSWSEVTKDLKALKRQGGTTIRSRGWSTIRGKSGAASPAVAVGGGKRVVNVKKNVRVRPDSSGEPAGEAAAAAPPATSKRSSARRLGESVLTLVQWAAIWAIWIVFARALLRFPPPPL